MKVSDSDSVEFSVVEAEKVSPLIVWDLDSENVGADLELEKVPVGPERLRLLVLSEKVKDFDQLLVPLLSVGVFGEKVSERVMGSEGEVEKEVVGDPRDSE